jgi:hypothetical protein
MEFFAKLNPRATPRSVLCRALISCVVSAGLWGVAVIFRFNPKFQPTWWAFIIFMLCAALVGAVWQWQVAPESDDDPQNHDRVLNQRLVESVRLAARFVWNSSAVR